MSTQRSSIGPLGKMFISTSLAWLLAEICLRLANISYPNFYRPDPILGAAYRPGVSAWQIREGRAFVSINSDGLRDREHELRKPPHTIRVAVLGDSMAAAEEVPVTDTFWAVMQRNLLACPAVAGKQIEAINFGVSSYGTAQELLMLRNRVWKYSPDVVVLAFTISNDVVDNSRELQLAEGMPGASWRPYFRLSSGKLVLDNSFHNSFRFRPVALLARHVFNIILDHSRVLQVLFEDYNLRRARASIRHMPVGPEPGVNFMVFGPPTDRVLVNAWKVTDRLIETMNEEVESHRAMFLVVTLTDPIEVDPDPARREAFMKYFGLKDLFYPDRHLMALGQHDGFEVLNLGSPLLAYAERYHVYLHGFRNTRLGTGHWNENGHRLAGELIARRLCDMFERTAAMTGTRPDDRRGFTSGPTTREISNVPTSAIR